MNWILVAAVVGVVSVVAWRTIEPTMSTIGSIASELPVGPRLDLVGNTTARLDNVRAGEVVCWRDDLHVAFGGGTGTWIRRDSGGGIVVEDANGTIGPIRLSHLCRDARTKRLLAERAQTARPLTAVVTCDGTVARDDLVSRQALVGEHATAPK